MRRISYLRWNVSTFVLSLAAGMLAAPQLSLAQSATAAPEGQDRPTASSEVIVTGSRVARNSFNAPTPVNVLGAERLENLAVKNVGDALNQMPSFRAVTTPATNLYRNGPNISARNVDLRGLGASRTLVLVDGRRFVPSSELGTVDLNAVPSSMISRAETVTGGASAAYGGDAIAGVVNLILDSKFTGFKTETSYGRTERGDAEEVHASFLTGRAFANDRIHTVLGAEFVDEGRSGDCFTREWCSHSTNLIANNTPGVNGQPATLLADEVWVIINRGGVIRTGPLAGTTFDPQGNPIPFKFGANVNGQFMIGGDASVGRSLATEKYALKTAAQYYSAFSHNDFDVTDKITATFELSYARVQGGPTGGSDQTDFSRPITIDNVYLPAATRTAMINAGITSFNLERYNSEVGPSVSTSDNTTVRGMFGLKGELWNNWSWDAYYQYGETKGKAFIANNRNLAKWYQSIDAVAGPGGRIVCRVALTDPTSACIPVNLFGAGRASKDAVAWAVGTAWQTRKIKQETTALNVRGDLFDLWGAGPVSSAFGAEYRKDHSEGDADPLSQTGGWQTQAGSVLGAGGQDVKEAYAEFNVPLLKDMPAARSLEFDAAGRYTEYSVSGAARTWKLGLVYRPIDQVMFRVTRSSDIRAPSAAELNPASTRVFLNVNDPVTRSTYFVDIFSGGNSKLALERADTTTYGVVLEPSFVPGLRLSADYYDISVGGAIDILSGQQTLNICASGNAVTCNFITRNGANLITSINATYQNLNSLRSKGVEIVADYSIDIEKLYAPVKGKLDLSLSATHTDELSTTDAFGFVTEYSGWTGNPGTIQAVFGVPKWRYNVLATYSDGPWAVSFNGRYVGDGVYDPTKIGPYQAGYNPAAANSINYNHVDARFYVDLTARFDITKNAQLFGSVINLADRDPPRQRLYGNPMLFDGIGRRFTVGVRTNW